MTLIFLLRCLVQLNATLPSVIESPLWLLVHIAPIRDENDEVLLFLCTYRDITSIKEPLAEDDTTQGRQNLLYFW